MDGTLTWVLQKPQYNDWISDPVPRLLLVTGYVGSGKTVLASYISQYLNEQHPKALVCRYFCDEKIDEYRDPCTLLKSLIFQIVDQRRRLWRLVKKASDAGGFNIFSQFDALWNLFVQLARTETRYSIIIIIDALDELEKNVQSRVVARIIQLLTNVTITSVKFFITTRPTAEGVAGVQITSPQVLHLSLVDSKEDIDKDIKSVVHYRLGRMVREGICTPAVGDRLEEMLVAKADQTFLWITLVLPLLEERRILLVTDVEKIAKLDLPVSLAAVYEHLLLLIPEEDRALAAKILRLLVVCDRPLACEEVSVMLTITPNHRSALSLREDNLSLGQNSIQTLLGPLVRIHDSRIVLLHQSLKEYLISICTKCVDSMSSVFGVDVTQDKQSVAQACAMYLSLEEFQRDIQTTLRSMDDYSSEDEKSVPSHSSSLYGLDLFDEPMFKEDLPHSNDHAWATVKARFPLFDYAALHWAEDFARCQDSITHQDTQKVLSLCSTDTALLKTGFTTTGTQSCPLSHCLL